MLEFAVLASGSGGNATVVQKGESALLVDAGLSSYLLAERLFLLGIEPGSITDVILTHGHIDHVRGARRGQLEFGWRLWATQGCVNTHGPLQRIPVNIFKPGDTLYLGGFEVKTVEVSHDSPETVGVRVTELEGLASVAILTDLGQVDEAACQLMQGVNALVIETNHDPHKLAKGSYPPALKARVASNKGHLSNTQGIEACMKVMHEYLQWVVLAHLSEENNDATLALNSFKKAVTGPKWKGQVRMAWPDRSIGLFQAIGPKTGL